MVCRLLDHGADPGVRAGHILPVDLAMACDCHMIDLLTSRASQQREQLGLRQLTKSNNVSFSGLDCLPDSPVDHDKEEKIDFEMAIQLYQPEAEPNVSRVAARFSQSLVNLTSDVIVHGLEDSPKGKKHSKTAMTAQPLQCHENRNNVTLPRPSTSLGIAAGTRKHTASDRWMTFQKLVRRCRKGLKKSHSIEDTKPSQRTKKTNQAIQLTRKTLMLLTFDDIHLENCTMWSKGQLPFDCVENFP